MLEAHETGVRFPFSPHYKRKNIGVVEMSKRNRGGIEHETFRNSSVLGMSGNKFALIAVPISLVFWSIIIYAIIAIIDSVFNTGIIKFLSSFFN